MIIIAVHARIWWVAVIACLGTQLKARGQFMTVGNRGEIPKARWVVCICDRTYCVWN